MRFTKSPYLLSFFASLGLISCNSFSWKSGPPDTIITASGQSSTPAKILRKSAPQLLRFDELTSLAEKPNPEGKLADKIDKLLTTPFVDNSAYFRSGIPNQTIHPELGRSLRVSTWNIEKSIRIADVAEALTSDSRFDEMLKKDVRERPKSYSEVIRQRAALAASDVLLLQEMDIGSSALKLPFNFSW